MSDNQILSKYDDLLKNESNVAALVVREWLLPAEGKDAVIFPPTYPIGDNEKTGYNIDDIGGRLVCLIDSVGSQANRIEPIFKREPYNELVPQVVVKYGGQEINLLDVGHRAADATMRFSNFSGLQPKFKEGFDEYSKGNAEVLAKIAPTSILFGAWDSRETQVKIPRIIRSVIRAFDVKELTRSAQYIPPLSGKIGEDLKKELEGHGGGKKIQDKISEMGLGHVPAVRTHGGILVNGEIRRDVIIKIETIRGLKALDPNRTLTLRRYILGLALVCITAPQERCLREGCELVPDKEKPAQWTIVRHDGSRENFSITHEEALEYAKEAATAFFGRIPAEPCVGNFEIERAKEKIIEELKVKDTQKE